MLNGWGPRRSSSTTINQNRQARWATFRLLVKLGAVVAFFAVILMLGVNPFTGEGLEPAVEAEGQ